MIRIQNNSHHISSLMKGSQETCKDERRKAFVSNWFMVVLSWGSKPRDGVAETPEKTFIKRSDGSIKILLLRKRQSVSSL